MFLRFEASRAPTTLPGEFLILSHRSQAPSQRWQINILNKKTYILSFNAIFSGNLFLTQVSSAPAANLARWAADQVLPIFLSREHLFIQNSIFGDVGGSFLLETKCRDILLPLLQPKVANIIITSMMTSYHRFGITDTLHHCRACGEGFCHTCSDYKVKAFDIFVSMKNIHYSSQRHDRLPNYNSSEPMSWPRMGISARESVQELLRARYCLPVGKLTERKCNLW